MKLETKLENETYTIIYNAEAEKENIYEPLLRGLWDCLTTLQKNNLIVITPDNNKIINFNTLINNFKYNKELDNFNEGRKCICGEDIINISYVTNIITKSEIEIGCECIKWWKCGKDVRNKLTTYKAKVNKKEIPIFCSFCKCQRKCINCKPKKSIKNIFDAWKTFSKNNITELYYNLNSEVKFGKYKGEKYYKLCKDEGYVAYLFKTNCYQQSYSILKNYARYRLLLKKDKYKRIVN